MGKALYVFLASSLLTQTGCTFYSWGNGVQPRTASELKDISPAIYIVLAIFSVILIASVACALFCKTTKAAVEKDRDFFARESSERGVAVALAFVATLVILLLVG